MTQELKYARLSNDLILRSKAPAIAIPDVYLSDLLHHKLTVHHEKVILIDGRTSEPMNGWQIRDTASTIARSFLDYDIREGDVIFGYCVNSSVYGCSLLACTFIGAVFTGCMHSYPLRDVSQQLSDSEAKVLLCCSSNLNVATQAANIVSSVVLIVVMDADFREVKLTSSRKRIISIEQMLSRCNRPNDQPMPITPLKKKPAIAIALSAYSSGSTGAPKGVLKTHANYVGNLMSPEPGLHFACRRMTDIVSCHMPFAHSTGNITLFAAMYFGFTAIVNDGFVVDQFLRCIPKYKMSYSYIAPSYIAMLSKSSVVKDYDVSSLTAVVTGGASLPQTAVKPFLAQFSSCERLVQIYGITEGGCITCVDDGYNNYATAGRPLRGVRIKIMDRQSGKALSFNETGEILIDGPEKMIGYFKRPDADAENITSDGWIRSGDAGFFNEEGLIFIVDRLKEVIKVDSLQVSPSELESVLVSHESVSEAAVIGIKDEVHGEVPKAFVVPKDISRIPDAKVLMTFVNDQVASFKQIKELLLVQSLPKISIGKIDRPSLKRDPESLILLSKYP